MCICQKSQGPQPKGRCKMQQVMMGNPTKKQFQVWTPAESDNVHDGLKPHQINFSQAAGPVPCRIGFPGSQLPLFLLPAVQTTRGTIYNRNIQIPNAAFAWITCWKINNLPHFDKFKSLFALNACYQLSIGSSLIIRSKVLSRYALGPCAP